MWLWVWVSVHACAVITPAHWAVQDGHATGALSIQQQTHPHTISIDRPLCCTSPHSLHCEETGRPRTMHIRYAIEKESAAVKGVVAKAADGASRKSSRHLSKTAQQDGWTEVTDKRW